VTVTAAPLVSVVMPTFNRQAFLGAAIESVHAQTFKDLEFIIADDGSDAPTRAYLRETAARLPLQVVWLEHSGSPALTRNAGVAAARGRYLAFLDSDDSWLPEKIEQQLAALARDPDARWCYTNFLRTDEVGAVLAEEASRRFTAHRGWIFDRVLETSAAIRTPAVMVCRDLFDEVGGFDEKLRACEDYDLWMRLALRAKAAVVEAPLVRVRLGRDSVSRDGAPVFADRDVSLRKIAGQVSALRRRRVRVERARNARMWMRDAARSGGRAALFDVVAASLGCGWTSARWWLSATRLCIRGTASASG
jgi:glycosyltransferase involved in cell wall biosynthesis